MSATREETKTFTDAFLSWLHGKGSVLIVVHDNPDPDALAAAMALKHLITMKTRLSAVITFGGTIARAENRVLVEELEIDLVPLEKIDPEDFDVVCMVDTQPGCGNTSFPLSCTVDLVVDHHPVKEQTRKVQWVDVREDYGTTASILYEYLMVHDIDIWTKLATILFYAIKSETQDLGREWSVADRNAYLNLVVMANNRILYQITHPKTPAKYFRYFNEALESAHIYGSVLIFDIGEIDIPEMVAELADFLLRTEGVDTTFGIGYFQGEGILSARTSRRDLPLGRTLATVLDGIGTAGGHGMMAGGQIRNIRGTGADDRATLLETLRLRFLDILGQFPADGTPLLTAEKN